jgi:Thiopurine S-methyltransferase (TPMT)
MNNPPTFPKTDPATPAFWDDRFTAEFTPWDQGGVPQSLRDYLQSNALPKRVLIPGCGA